MKVLVTGDRHWHNKNRIREVLSALTGVECIIEGGARGADTLALIVATELGIPVIEFPADWIKYGGAAGPIRNRQMLSEGKPGLVVAFHNNILKSKGTRDMVRIARAEGTKTRVYTEFGHYEGEV